MSLTADDLYQIEVILDRKLEPIRGEIQALRNDIKEIYKMIAELQHSSVQIDASFRKLPIKDQILKLNAVIIDLARQEGITLPR